MNHQLVKSFHLSWSNHKLDTSPLLANQLQVQKPSSSAFIQLSKVLSAQTPVSRLWVESPADFNVPVFLTFHLQSLLIETLVALYLRHWAIHIRIKQAVFSIKPAKANKQTEQHSRGVQQLCTCSREFQNTVSPLHTATHTSEHTHIQRTTHRRMH